VTFGLMVKLLLLTFVAGVPATCWWVVRMFRGPIMVVAGWWLLTSAGFVEGWAGPFGLPWLAVWVLGVVAAAVWLWTFVRLTVRAWKAALQELRMWMDAEHDLAGM
jgi:hypothetical protein